MWTQSVPKIIFTSAKNFYMGGTTSAQTSKRCASQHTVEKMITNTKYVQQKFRWRKLLIERNEPYSEIYENFLPVKCLCYTV